MSLSFMVSHTDPSSNVVTLNVAYYIPVFVTLKCSFFRTGAICFLTALTTFTVFLGSSAEVNSQ